MILHPGIEEFFNYMLEQYRIPGLAKVAGSFCAIMFVFAIAFWIMPIIEKWKFGYHKLCYYSKQISKIYAVHIGVYYVIGGFAAFKRMPDMVSYCAGSNGFAGSGIYFDCK